MAAESSLLLREKLTLISSRDYCGKAGAVNILDHATRLEVIPLFCHSWGCPRCGLRKGREWIKRISAQKIERFITLTCQTTRFANPQVAAAEMKAAFAVIVRRIRRKFGKFEYGGFWELHKSGYPHLHILSVGSYIPQKWLSLQWKSLGIGFIVHISQVKSARQCARYVAKYLVKGARRTWEAFPNMRLVQVSAGFDGGGNGEAVKKAAPGGKLVRVEARFPQIVEYLMLDLGFMWVDDDDQGRVYLRAPPGGFRRVAKEPWQYKLLAQLIEAADG